MNLADQLTLENSIGRLHAVECAIQALVLTHPDPAAFGETLHALMASIESRPERDGNDPHVQIRQGFRDGCSDFRRAAEVAVSTGPDRPNGANGNGNGHAAFTDGSGA
jgi:hypothetical protein